MQRGARIFRRHSPQRRLPTHGYPVVTVWWPAARSARFAGRTVAADTLGTPESAWRQQTDARGVARFEGLPAGNGYRFVLLTPHPSSLSPSHENVYLRGRSDTIRVGARPVRWHVRPHGGTRRRSYARRSAPTPILFHPRHSRGTEPRVDSAAGQTLSRAARNRSQRQTSDVDGHARFRGCKPDRIFRVRTRTTWRIISCALGGESDRRTSTSQLQEPSSMATPTWMSACCGPRAACG